MAGGAVPVPQAEGWSPSGCFWPCPTTGSVMGSMALGERPPCRSRCGGEVGSSHTGSGAGFMAYLPSRFTREAESPGVSPGLRVPRHVPAALPSCCRRAGSCGVWPHCLEVAEGGWSLQGRVLDSKSPVAPQGRGHLGRAVVCSLLLKARPSLNTTPADPGLPAQCLEIRSCGAIPGLETPI